MFWLGLAGKVLTIIPGLTDLGSKWVSASYDAKVKMFMAKTGADRDVAVAAIEAQGAVQVRWWFAAAIPPLWALPYVLYDWKVVFWDNVLGELTHGSTPPLYGTANWVHITIVTFYFLHGLAQSNR